MTEFLVISDWGHIFTRLGSFFSEFFWDMTSPLGNMLNEWTDRISFFDSIVFDLIFVYLNRFTVLEFIVGVGLTFVVVAHFIKLLREAFLF